VLVLYWSAFHLIGKTERLQADILGKFGVNYKSSTRDKQIKDVDHLATGRINR
jgi:hypothetical protein